MMSAVPQAISNCIGGVTNPHEFLARRLEKAPECPVNLDEISADGLYSYVSGSFYSKDVTGWFESGKRTNTLNRQPDNKHLYVSAPKIDGNEVGKRMIEVLPIDVVGRLWKWIVREDNSDRLDKQVKEIALQRLQNEKVEMPYEAGIDIAVGIGRASYPLPALEIDPSTGKVVIPEDSEALEEISSEIPLQEGRSYSSGELWSSTLKVVALSVPAILCIAHLFVSVLGLLVNVVTSGIDFGASFIVA